MWYLVSLFMCIVFASPLFGAVSGNPATLKVSAIEAGNIIHRVDTIAALRSISGGPGKKSAQVMGYYAVGDGGGGPARWWDASSTCTDDGGACIDPAAPGTGRWRFDASGRVSVAWFGATGSGNESAIVTAAATAAAADGGSVFIPFATLQVSTGTDVKGVDVEGSGTALTGTLINYRTLSGVIVNTREIDQRVYHPPVGSDTARKLLKKSSDNFYQVVVPKRTRGYALIDLKNNLTTPTDSLASTTSDLTSFRVTGVVDCVDVLVGYTTASASTGTWNNVNNTTGIEEPFDSGVEYVYKQSPSGGTGDYSLSITVPESGIFNVGFVRSSGSAADVSVQVDGVTIDANFSLVSAAAVLDVRTYRTTPGARVIKIVKNVSTGTVNLLGVNFYHLKDAPLDRSYDTWGYYRNVAIYDSYLASTSANDYAIRDKDANLWGGSYHGGESAITTRWVVGGLAVTPSTSVVYVSSSIAVEQDWTIDWTGAGGGSLSCWSLHSFIHGGYNLETAFSGGIRAESFFTTLYGINTDFDLIQSPSRINIPVDLSDGENGYLGQNNHVVYINTTTKQKILITHTLYHQNYSAKGGAYVWRVVGLYHKYYYSPIDRGDKDITDMSAVNQFIFE